MFRKAVFIALACSVIMVSYQSPAQGRDDGPSVEDSVAQAKHYFRKGLLTEAAKAIRQALSTEEGREDAKVQLLAAKIFRDRGDIDRCFRALAKAREYGDDAQKAEADKLYKGLKRSFGEVRILTEGGVHVKGRIYLESMERFINVKRKTLFKGVQRALLVRARRYPDSIWIPYGHYKANGVEFRHEEGKRTSISLRFPKVAILRSGAKGEKALIKAFKARTGGIIRVFSTSGERAALRERLKGWRPELVVAIGDEAARFAAKKLKKVPMLYGMLTQLPGGLGLERRMDVAGVAGSPSPEDMLVRLAKVVPKVERLGVIHLTGVSIANLERAATRVGVEKVVDLEVEAGGSPTDALDDDTLDGLDAVMVLGPAPFGLEGAGALGETCLARHIPLVVPELRMLKAGALMAVVPNPRRTGIQLAHLARKVLFAGADISDLEVESPERPGWYVSRRRAEKLGIELGDDLVAELDGVL